MQPHPALSLITAVARAHHWVGRILRGESDSQRALANRTVSMNAISVGSSRWPFLHQTLLNQSSRVDIRRILASRPSARPFPTAGMSRELSSDCSKSTLQLTQFRFRLTRSKTHFPLTRRWSDLRGRPLSISSATEFPRQ
jgi:hypothetical protein